MLRNQTGLRHRRGGPGDVRDVPRSHPQAANPVLTTLRAARLCLQLKVVTLRAPCLFLMQCKAEYKTHVRLESGDESPHSKDASRRGSNPKGDAPQRRFASREQPQRRRTPKTLRVAGTTPKATHPKVAARLSDNQRKPTARRTLTMVFSASAPAFSAPFARTLQT